MMESRARQPEFARPEVRKNLEGFENYSYFRAS
jgi:hypothetical protein